MSFSANILIFFIPYPSSKELIHSSYLTGNCIVSVHISSVIDREQFFLTKDAMTSIIFFRSDFTSSQQSRKNLLHVSFVQQYATRPSSLKVIWRWFSSFPNRTTIGSFRISSKYTVIFTLSWHPLTMLVIPSRTS